MQSRHELLRTLFRELSSDNDDMAGLLDSLFDPAHEDRQAFIAELTQPKLRRPYKRTKVVYDGPNRILGPAETLRLLGIPRSVFYILVSRGGFPPPLHLKHGRIGWPRHIVEIWAVKGIVTREPSGNGPREVRLEAREPVRNGDGAADMPAYLPLYDP